MQNNVYTEENYKKIIDTIKNIKKITNVKEKTEKTYISKIYEALNNIEDQCGFKPSYQKFLNALITDKNLEDATLEIIEELEQQNMAGYSPDIKTLIEKITTDKNLEELKKTFIKQIEAIN
jgi:lipopolysaccharide biosynthesis regulator YciM